MRLFFALLTCVLSFNTFYASAQEIFLDPNFFESSTTLLSDGAQSNNINDDLVKVSLSKVNATTLQVSIFWKGISNDANTINNGISLKAFHFDGFSFTPIFFKHFPAGTFAANIENIETFQFSVPTNFANDTQFVRVSLIDNCMPFEDIVGNFACDTCGTSNGCPVLDFDNVDIPFLFQSCSINLGVVPTSLCAASSFDVSYRLGGLQNCIFNPGNEFFVVLSDSTGNFNSPSIIGSLSSITDGTITATIPSFIVPGIGYRIRIASSNPFYFSEENGTDIAILPTPAAAFSTSSTCLGNTSTIINQSVFNSGSLNYFWDFGDGSQSQNPSPSKTYTVSGNYSITLITLASNGCRDTASQIHQVLPSPVAGFITENICLGDSASFTNTTLGTSVAFQWSFGDGFFSIAPNPKHLYLSPAQHTVQLISTNTFGCADTVTNSISIFEKPEADFDFSNLCLGNAITFINQSSISAGTLNYNWDFGDGSQSIAVSPTKNFMTADTFSVQLIATSNQTCTDTSIQNVIIFENTEADFLAVPVCLGDSTLFINLGDTAATQFLWNFGDGNFSINPQPSHLYAAEGLFAVQLIASNAHCADTITKNIDVFATPIAAFSSTDNCLGVPTVFQNQSALSLGNMNFNWSFGDSSFSSNPDPTHQYQQAGNFTATLSVVSEKGCTDTSFLNIHIYEQPKADFEADNVCLGDSIFFINLSQPASALQFIWNFGDGDTSQSINAQHLYIDDDNFTVRLLAESIEGCSDSVSKVVSVYPQPKADFTAVNSCFGAPTPFTNQSQSFFSLVNYLWDFGDGNFSALENPTNNYDSIGIYRVSLKITNSMGCYDSTNQSVVIFPTPIANFNANTACFNQEVVFTDTSQIFFGKLNYAWNFGDGSAEDTIQNPTHIFSTLGVFDVTLRVISDEGCEDETQQQITVHPNPTANFSAPSDCENDTIRFQNFSSLSNGNLNYYWDFGDGTKDLSFEPFHVFQQVSGNLPVTLVALSNQNCADTITKNIFILPAPQVNFEAENICWPNPLNLSADILLSSGIIANRFWDFGDGTDSRQSNVEKFYEFPGTYTIRLQAESDNGCFGGKEKTIVVYPKPDATIRILGKPAFCIGEETLLSAGTLRHSFLWSTLETTQDITVSEQGIYSVTVSNDLGCSDSAETFITVFELPFANAGEDVTVSKGFSVQLNASGGVAFEWSPIENLNRNDIANPFASPLETTTYTVTVTDQNGCRNSDEVIVEVRNDFLLEVTNVLTANGDGVNDYFEIFNIENYPQAELKIYNRWGTEVFKAMPYRNDWNGKHSGNSLPDGTYYYVIKIEGIDVLYKGSISILR